MKNIGIYIHIPFCKQKCKYCDFTSFQNKSKLINDYFECLLIEIEEKSKDYNVENINGKKQKVSVDTIYIGGGTPSFVDENYIEKMLVKIKQHFKVLKSAEITIEVNPGTVTENKLKKYYEIGINRLSIGLQSTNDTLLKMLGRIHNYSDFENTYTMARKVGFRNINVDLMIGLPQQSIKDVEDSLQMVVKKSPKHISVYSLIVEENTKIYDLIKKGELKLPDENTEREMYWIVKNRLEEAGYIHYEISNFAKPNKQSKHNVHCWNQESYLGIGVAAHSYFNAMRFSNTDNIKKYIENYRNNESIRNVILHENQDKEKMMKEYMLLGLRKIDGINITKFKNKFTVNPLYIFAEEINKLHQEGLLEVEGNSISLTNKGLDLANLVWVEFV